MIRWQMVQWATQQSLLLLMLLLSSSHGAANCPNTASFIAFLFSWQVQNSEVLAHELATIAAGINMLLLLVVIVVGGVRRRNQHRSEAVVTT